MKPERTIENLISSIDVRPDSAKCRQTLDAMRQAQSAASAPAAAPSIWRTLMKTRMTQLTAAAAILIAAAVIWTQLAFVQPTFAEVVKPLLEAKTLVYDFIVGPDEVNGPVMHDIVAGSRIRRTISTMPTITMILDTEQAKMLHLENNEKKATYFDMNGPLQLGTQEFLKFIRQTIRQVQTQTASAPVSLGTTELDGKKVVGYAIGQTQKIEIWADAKTSLPVRIKLGIGPQVTTIKNFEFDVPVDPALVSMDVPAGYTLATSNMDLSDATEEDFVAGLKAWAEVFLNGHFPESITTDQYMKMVPQLKDAVIKLNLSAQEAERFGTSFMKGMMFITLFPAKGHEQWHYAGSGVKLGDASKAIFWYRPKDGQNYRVLYGDLRVEETPPDKLPQ